MTATKERFDYLRHAQIALVADAYSPASHAGAPVQYGDTGIGFSVIATPDVRVSGADIVKISDAVHSKAYNQGSFPFGGADGENRIREQLLFGPVYKKTNEGVEVPMTIGDIDGSANPNQVYSVAYQPIISGTELSTTQAQTDGRGGGQTHVALFGPEPVIRAVYEPLKAEIEGGDPEALRDFAARAIARRLGDRGAGLPNYGDWDGDTTIQITSFAESNDPNSGTLVPIDNRKATVAAKLGALTRSPSN